VGNGPQQGKCWILYLIDFMPFILPLGGADMDNDSPTTPGCKGQPEEERQNRRQFFNGLGKWSLAIIAAVTALREGVQDLQSAIGSRLETGSGGPGEPRQQIAKKKGPHGDQPHIDNPHDDYTHDHRDYYRREVQPGGTTPSGPGGSLDKTQ
jgi:hypothetical protein